MKKQIKISDYIKIGTLPSGKYNKISDVKGVRVGHATIKNEQNCTGVTVILPSEKNPFTNKLEAAAYVLNGYGKSVGLVQIEELGLLEAPIALTNTLNVGKVLDGMLDYMIDISAHEGVLVHSINIPVLECNDSEFNNIRNRAVGTEHVSKAINNACEDFEEGDVGGGTGMKCHGLKGGIGSASRIVNIGDKDYTIGVLVQTNHGYCDDFRIDGKKIGAKIRKHMEASTLSEKGSVIVVVATDIPMSSRQLKRILKRVDVGLIRNGSYTTHGSGEVFVAFSTANVHPKGESEFYTGTYLNDDYINPVFRAVGEATEEAVINAMLNAEGTTTLAGHTVHGLSEYLDLILEEFKE